MSDPTAPIQAPDAELAVVGSMLIEIKAAQRARLELDAEDFYLQGCREIFQAAVDLTGEDVAPDTVTVIERLRLTGRLEAAGGAEGVLAAIGKVASASHVNYYCKIVKQASLQRQFFTQVRVVDGEPTSAGVQKLDDLLMRIHGEGVGRIVDFQEDLASVVEEILSKPVLGYATGFFHLDTQLNRVEPGDLVVIGARTSGGKTAFMLQMAVNMAAAGTRVCVGTTEMDDVQLIKRLLPAASGVPAFRFRAGSLSDSDKGKVRRAVVDKLQHLPIKIIARPRMSLKDIRGALIKSDCEVFFFDYLQRAKMPKAESRVYEIEEFMVGLKTLARATGKVIVTAVQLDRGMDKNPTVPPELSDLRGSGAIEAESDTVILLWKPPPAVQQKRVDWVDASDGCVAIEALIKKNRHGPAPCAADFELNGNLVQIAERAINKREPDALEEEQWYK